jgi:hypothetical protein
MKMCPHCEKHPGVRQFRGYCSKVHYQLAKRKPKKVVKNCKSCGKVVVRAPSAIAPSGNVYCRICKKPSGENHGKWTDGQYIGPDGYRMVLHNGSYQREHRVVWMDKNKSSLLPSGTIHHVDYDKLNNTADNLLLFSDEEHGRFHRLADAGRIAEAAALLRMAANRQIHYPAGVETWISQAEQKEG